MRFVDLSLGFETRNYSPVSQTMAARRQTERIGLTLNLQGVLDELLPDSRGRRIGHGLFELFTPPYTTLRGADYSRSPD